MAHDTSFSREHSENSQPERGSGNTQTTHLSVTDGDVMSSALQTIGELADSALHCLRTEVRLNCYAQIHLMRGRRYSWKHASQMQREARESPVPEAFVVSLAQYLCSVEEEVMPSLSKSSADFIVYGLPQLLTQLLLEGVRHARHNEVCHLGMKQIVCNCRALANAWACCRGVNSTCVEQTREDATCFQVAERAIELLVLPPMWCRELLEHCTEKSFEKLLQQRAQGASNDNFLAYSQRDIEALRLLHSRGIFDIISTVNRHALVWGEGTK
jgi:hypothetical protein